MKLKKEIAEAYLEGFEDGKKELKQETFVKNSFGRPRMKKRKTDKL